MSGDFFVPSTGSVAGIVISDFFLIKQLPPLVAAVSFRIFIYKKIENFQLLLCGLSAF
jgi:hypothetical protein